MSSKVAKSIFKDVNEIIKKIDVTCYFKFEAELLKWSFELNKLVRISESPKNLTRLERERSDHSRNLRTNQWKSPK